MNDDEATDDTHRNDPMKPRANVTHVASADEISLPVPPLEEWMLAPHDKLAALEASPYRLVINMNKPESICKAVADAYFGTEFTKIRHPNIRNPLTGHKLELDVYCASVSLAIEYQGITHYQYPNWLTKQGKQDRPQFLAAVERDKIKRKRSQELGITLIEIPYTYKYADIPLILLNIFDRLGYQSQCVLR
jgi:hypothetical protein